MAGLTATIREATRDGDKFRFDVLLENSNGVIPMGNSSFAFTMQGGTLSNPKLLSMDPSFDQLPEDSRSSRYGSVVLVQYSAGKKLLLQIKHKGGEANFIQKKSLLATIEMDIVPLMSYMPIRLRWNLLDSAIVTPTFQTIETEWVGAFVEPIK